MIGRFFGGNKIVRSTHFSNGCDCTIKFHEPETSFDVVVYFWLPWFSLISRLSPCAPSQLETFVYFLFVSTFRIQGTIKTNFFLFSFLYGMGKEHFGRSSLSWEQVEVNGLFDAQII